MDINFATNTTMTLLNRLGRSSTDSSFEVDSSSTANLGDSYSSTGVSTDNYHTLIIRDSLQTGGYMYGAISLYSQQLDQLSGYLVQLRDKEVAIMAETAGSAAHTQLVAEKQTIETSMSAFIGENIHGNELNLVSVQGGTAAANDSFMDVINVRENSSDPNSDIVGMVSSVEVDLMEIFAHSHNESTCPHCLQAASISGGEQPIEIATSSTSGATADKGATTSSTSLDSQVETIRSGYKWNVSSSDTLSYSFYEGTVPYPTTYNDGNTCLLYTSPSPRDLSTSRMPSSA